ncbi:MAG: glutathione S-transferase family protein [Alphaproteobacteria bacterium]
MILIGQYDSPFVRRVGIALTLYGMPFAHRPWSTFGDAEQIRPYNPLTRVPTLVRDDGESLIDSHAILDHLDSMVLAAARMFPADEPARRRAIKVASLATGLGEKAVALFYEHRMHREVSPVWDARCRAQISAVLAVLEPDRASRRGAWWFGEAIGHADIAVAVVLRFVAEAHPGLVDMERYPALAAHAARAEALPAFRAIRQPFIPPE